MPKKFPGATPDPADDPSLSTVTPSLLGLQSASTLQTPPGGGYAPTGIAGIAPLNGHGFAYRDGRWQTGDELQHAADAVEQAKRRSPLDLLRRGLS